MWLEIVFEAGAEVLGISGGEVGVDQGSFEFGKL